MHASLEPVVEQPVGVLAVARRATGGRSSRTQRFSSSAVCGYSSLSIMFLDAHSAISFSASGSIHVVTNVARFSRATPSNRARRARSGRRARRREPFSASGTGDLLAWIEELRTNGDDRVAMVIWFVLVEVACARTLGGRRLLVRCRRYRTVTLGADAAAPDGSGPYARMSPSRSRLCDVPPSVSAQVLDHQEVTVDRVVAIDPDASVEVLAPVDDPLRAVVGPELRHSDLRRRRQSGVETPRRLPGGQPDRLRVDVCVGGALTDSLELRHGLAELPALARVPGSHLDGRLAGARLCTHSAASARSSSHLRLPSTSGPSAGPAARASNVFAADA